MKGEEFYAHRDHLLKEISEVMDQMEPHMKYTLAQDLIYQLKKQANIEK